MRRNAIVLFMCVELMLNAVNLAFVALAPYAGLEGQVFVFFVIADNLPVDSTYYPESDKWQIKPQRKLFRMQETHYFDGEE